MISSKIFKISVRKFRIRTISCKGSRLNAVASHEQSGASGNKYFKLFLDRASSNPAFQLLKSVLKLLLKNPQSITKLISWRFSKNVWTCNEQAGLVQQGVENLKSWKQKRFYCSDHHLNLYDKGRLSFNKSSIEWYYRHNSVISLIRNADSECNYPQRQLQIFRP